MYMYKKNAIYLDSKVKHQTVRILLSQLIEQLSPGGKLNHFSQPGWCLRGSGQKQLNLGEKNTPEKSHSKTQKVNSKLLD